MNTPEWPNSHNLKIQDGNGRHLEFRKNVNNSGLDKNICTKFYSKMHHGHAEMILSAVLCLYGSFPSSLTRSLVESLFSQSNSPSYIMTTSTVFGHQTSEVIKLFHSFQILSIDCDLHSSSFYHRHSHDFSLLRIDSHVVLL